jgi:hypothetical protein
MPTKAVFHCQFCDAVPDHGTQRSLAGQVSERMFGEYLDAFPGRWLVWNGGGPLGPRRYACREHRGDLVAYLRYHYATVAAQVWKMPPYTARWPDEKRPHMGGSMGIIKFGLRGGLLQDPPASPPHRGAPAASDRSNPDAAEDPASGAPSAPGDAPGGAPSAPGDAPVETPSAAADELLGPDDSDPPVDMFPPGQLYLPTDGAFAPGQGTGSSGGGEADEPSWPSDDDAWPRDDGSWPPDDGPWPKDPPPDLGPPPA